ncbi:hypothetical protein Ahy_A05g022231 isoform B [Arachis hypogaea]|uniref:Tetratricopeptide repeat protein n=1 Tax=Arachis hypogaea TaxID=3818 RepID=A0A445D053_ARAHY|nr:hypothetical protein Ahy_A05g022231 isoform B [Arachis hypogaea]
MAGTFYDIIFGQNSAVINHAYLSFESILLLNQGNQGYKDKQWQKAIGFYSEAIKLSSNNANIRQMSKCILEEVELERCLAIIPMQLMIFNMPWYLNQPTKWHPPLPKD